MFRRAVIVSLVCLSATFSVPSFAASRTFTPEDVRSVTALAKMRGHLVASLVLWEARAFALAAGHSRHPIEELFATVAGRLRAKHADAALKSALDAYAALASKPGEAPTIRAAHKAALERIRTAEQTLAGPATSDPGFRGSVIIELLEGVEEEYAEAASGGRITQIIEYQDAMGFFTVAQERYDTIAATVKARRPRAHAEIQEQFAALKRGFPSFATPPARPADPKTVDEAIGEIAAELREALGLSKPATGGPAAYVAISREKVAQALKAYKAGKHDAAYELAVGAYLEGFERLEPTLLPTHRTLVEQLETQFKAFRDAIKAGKPFATVETLAQAINATLDKAQALLR